ncbi:MAG TPA: NBR1-Ig-like domain-containing protein [Longilinea sp.]|nr:NBR1-Ig-like domain-containing protein [Longilinea sp.]
MKKTYLPALVFIIALIALACNFPSSAAPTQDLNVVDTAVAQTLVAQTGQPSAQDTETVTPVPANTEAPTPLSTATNVPIPPTATSICDLSQFVSETVPDGSTFAPGSTFTKTWRVKNVGACTWTSSYAIVFDSGDHLGAPDAIPFPGNVAPGQEVDLSINMQAPSAPGNYESYWKFRNASGIIFVTTPYSAKINVVAPTSTTAPVTGITLIHPIITLLPLLLPNTQQVYNQVSVNAGAVGSASVDCPSGTLAVGGGFALGSDMIISGSYPSGNGWKTEALNNSSSSQLLNAYVICLSNTSGSVSSKNASALISAGNTGNAAITCPSGSIATGGGFRLNASYLQVYNSSKGGNGWQAYARNSSGINSNLTAYVTCLSGISGASTAQILSQTSISGNSTGSATAACASGSLLTGGGFALGNNLFVYNTSMTSDPTKWISYARNTAAGSQLINSYAICLSLP